jgi:hypothetical protein
MCSGKRVKNIAKSAHLSPFKCEMSANKGVLDALFCAQNCLWGAETASTDISGAAQYTRGDELLRSRKWTVELCGFPLFATH